MATLKNMHNYNDTTYLVIVPIEKVASNICSLILHSNTKGLALPARNKFKELIRERLSHSQRKYKDKLKLIFLDEFAIISQKVLCYADKRLSQIMCVNKLFRELVMIIFRDLGQLPPVSSNSL